MNCKEALPLMHEVLDGNVKGSDAIKLKEHFLLCKECHTLFQELERTDALVRSLPPAGVPDDLAARIMAGLPPAKRRNSWTQWVRKHPAVSVAALFIVMMFSSFLSMWNDDHELMVKGANLDNVVIEGDTVIVPQGRTVDGNLVVQSGKLKVEGDVKGNLVVIDGTLNLASTAHISGHITQIDQALSWVWYKINEFFSQFSK
jgi:anti-sigma factor RsiW